MDVNTERSRRLPWEDSFNIRDVGGYPAANGHQTRWQTFVRADDLSRLTPVGRQRLQDFGIRTVIDLRSPEQVTSTAHSFAGVNHSSPTITYHHLPFIDPTDTVGNIIISAASTLEAVYRILLERYQPSIATVLQRIADAPPGGVVVHCTAGKDRTGLITALVLATAGVPPAVIAADYALSDQYLPNYYAQRLASVEANPVAYAQLATRLTARADVMENLLAHVQQHYGGVETYLQRAGLAPQTLVRLRERVSEP